jgi:hypothetical protein
LTVADTRPENCVVIHLFVDFSMQRPLESPELDTTENLSCQWKQKHKKLDEQEILEK